MEEMKRIFCTYLIEKSNPFRHFKPLWLMLISVKIMSFYEVIINLIKISIFYGTLITEQSSTVNLYRKIFNTS